MKKPLPERLHSLRSWLLISKGLKVDSPDAHVDYVVEPKACYSRGDNKKLLLRACWGKTALFIGARPCHRKFTSPRIEKSWPGFSIFDYSVTLRMELRLVVDKSI